MPNSYILFVLLGWCCFHAIATVTSVPVATCATPCLGNWNWARRFGLRLRNNPLAQNFPDWTVAALVWPAQPQLPH